MAEGFTGNDFRDPLTIDGAIVCSATGRVAVLSGPENGSVAGPDEDAVALRIAGTRSKHLNALLGPKDGTTACLAAASASDGENGQGSGNDGTGKKKPSGGEV